MKKVIVSNNGVTKQGIRYVGKTHEAIQQAITYLKTNGGGTCFIENGTYLITAAIQVPSNIEICGEGRYTVLRNMMLSTSTGALRITSNENVYIHDLYIESGSTSTNAAPAMYASSSITSISDLEKYGLRIENCIIKKHPVPPIVFESVGNAIIKNNIIDSNESSSYPAGIFLYDCVYINICDNYITNNGNYGIEASDCSEVKVSGNIIKGNDYVGISFYDCYSSSICDNIILNNSSYGIYLREGTMIEVSNNIISDHYNSGIYCDSIDHLIIKSNSINNNSGNGIHMEYTRLATIMGNSIILNNSSGIQLYSCRYSHVVGNTMTRNGYYGLYISYRYDEQITATGNIFTDKSILGSDMDVTYNDV